MGSKSAFQFECGIKPANPTRMVAPLNPHFSPAGYGMRRAHTGQAALRPAAESAGMSAHRTSARTSETKLPTPARWP